MRVLGRRSDPDPWAGSAIWRSSWSANAEPTSRLGQPPSTSRRGCALRRATRSPAARFCRREPAAPATGRRRCCGWPPDHVGRTDTALGAFYRRLSARIGKAKAVTATARKIAVLFYNTLRHGMNYTDPGATMTRAVPAACSHQSATARQGTRLRSARVPHPRPEEFLRKAAAYFARESL